MATSNKKYKITYYSDDMELLNKMYMVAQQFDIKADEHGEKDLMKSTAVVLNEDHEDFNKSARQESNDQLLQAIKAKYK
ncbi:hypothetical protein ACVH8U_001418 [Yersinia enterocolitica]|uniref:hypothetical protein n=1 Tax=Yersinia TaxID=629 RepID=UPI000BFE32F2|nr:MULTISPECIES: hypothetical protein [Yersinia]ATM85939.1 hypothetical protein CRN74_07515 [Yersinia frederiksenii]MCB5316431.1 hypothetical protein [Yersinia massiliensis]HDL7708471.1 hypothetical protein [Yersinia enterocolitica]HEK6320246.1 hypothetical protein [Yersinia enterocolitica]